MKLFQCMLLSLAPFSMLVSLPSDAAEAYINDVTKFSEQSVKTVQRVKDVQFSDVFPGDWAYIALQNLSETTRCKDSLYVQTLESELALTRYEAASLINSCLEGDIAFPKFRSDVIRLFNEFGTEMAILRGRGGGLNYKNPAL